MGKKYYLEFSRIKKLLRVIIISILLTIFIQSHFVDNIFKNTPSSAQAEKKYEVFGFAPYWTINKLNTVSFETLTTLAYFDIPVDGEGNFVEDSPGYQTFITQKATNLFKKAHKNGTRVVVTFTQMNNPDIEDLMTNEKAQDEFIKKAVSLVKKRGLDGANIDFEYVGNPGSDLRNKFTLFTYKFTKKMHQEIPDSKVTVSVYASSVRHPKIYDVGKLSKFSDGIFMMAYDFATKTSDTAMPTSPLYGFKNGKYWYDISTAVDDFLSVMDRDKLILGLPWYGYDYPVEEPKVKADTYQGYYYYYWWWGRRYLGWAPGPGSQVQTYANSQNKVKAEKTGWDEDGKIGWKAYFENGVWRMFFMEDVKSLEIKYDFAKQKNLAGVGVWALGFEDGKKELWDLLTRTFGTKRTEASLLNKKIKSVI